MEKDCFICRKHAGTIQTAGTVIYEDFYTYVGHIDNNDKPHYLGYLIIDLKRHVPSLADMSAEEAKQFGIMMARASNALIEVAHAEHVYALVAGDAVPHLHLHLVPRYPGTPEEYWGINGVQRWDQAPYGSKEDVNELCSRLKMFMETGS